MEYLKTSEAARRWGVTPRTVRLWCGQGKIAGVRREGSLYLVPADAPLPMDGRKRWVRDGASGSASLYAEVDTLAARLRQARPLTQAELERLRDDFLVEFAYNSNAIEGNTLTLRETALVLEGITIDRKPLKDHLEAVGQRDAYAFVEQLATEREPISLHDIRAIHSLVLADRPDDRGALRTIPVRILGAYVEPPPPLLVEERLRDLLKADRARRRALHPIERIALFHLEFEGIHPFIDGNGRTGRLLMNLELLREGLLPVDVKFADRKRYYDAFDCFHRDGDASAMVGLIGGYEAERLRERLAMLEAE